MPGYRAQVYDPQRVGPETDQKTFFPFHALRVADPRSAQIKAASLPNFQIEVEVRLRSGQGLERFHLKSNGIHEICQIHERPSCYWWSLIHCHREGDG